ncbi:MAG: NTP transferase domain-containing protein [Proteobacteria bacterium]|nr:NTP transferase domain-containing protein [Pseudomonadota bacterium]MBU1686688.1 NTP transferase domain-containing protein [Pseudomonadota bacterium]
MSPKKILAVVLAAGKGTRMKSAHPKVLHEVFFRPMIHHVLNAIGSLTVDRIIVVVGYQADELRQSLNEYEVEFAIQSSQLGTAHAVLSAQNALSNHVGNVLILCGDTPLITSETLQELVCAHESSSAVLTVMTSFVSDPTNYGRIIRDDNGSVRRIVEHKDAKNDELTVCEINTGIYCVDSRFLLSGLLEIGRDNAQGEYYLTDLVAVARNEGHIVNRYECTDFCEVMGVNSRHELALASSALRDKRNLELMQSGVTLLEPETIRISDDVEVGADTVIGGNVILSHGTSIGQNCRIEANCIIRGCSIGSHSIIGPFCLLEHDTIEGHTMVRSNLIHNENDIL